MRTMVDGWNRSPRAGPVALRVEGGDDAPEGEPVRQQPRIPGGLDVAGADAVLREPQAPLGRPPMYSYLGCVETGQTEKRPYAPIRG